MQEQRQRHSNLQPYIRASDSAGNLFFLSHFGLATLQSRALAGEDILALRYAEYLCGWQANHHERIREDDVSGWWHRFAEEHKLHVQGIGEELLRLPNGEPITADIAGIISRCHADNRFSPAWGNRKHVAPNLSALHEKFSRTRLPKYREGIEYQAQPATVRVEQALRQWGVRLTEERGIEGAALGYGHATKVLTALSDEAEQKREDLTKKRSEFAARVAQAIGKVADAAGAWHRLVGRREAEEEALEEAFRFIGEVWRVEVSFVVLSYLIRMLTGFEDDEGQVARVGLVATARQLKDQAEQEVKRWRERREVFQQAWQSRLQLLRNRALDFEAILDADFLEAERLDEVFASRVSASGVVAESIGRLHRFLRTSPTQQQLKDFLVSEGHRVFRGALGGSLEEEVAADPTRLRELTAVIRKSKPLASVREEVLKRWRIARRERSLTIFTVADPEHSAIKHALLRTVEGITEDCFVRGQSERLVALQESWGLPVYALSSIGKYRDAYQACLRDPAERSLHAAPRVAQMPEIEEPETKKRQRSKVRGGNSSPVASSNGLQQPLLEQKS